MQIPLGSKKLLWSCSICRWQASRADVDPQPNPASQGGKMGAPAAGGGGGPGIGMDYMPAAGRGYDVGYSTGAVGAKVT